VLTGGLFRVHKHNVVFDLVSEPQSDVPATGAGANLVRYD